MRNLVPLLFITAVHASTETAESVDFIRQTQQSGGVVWDMPVAASGFSLVARIHENGDGLFQWWSVGQSSAKECLLDQKLVGAYLPAADIQVTTLDPYTKVPRTRVDQSFTVDINLSGLLPAGDFPRSASSVLLERHLGSYQADRKELDQSTLISGAPSSSAYLSANGKTSLRFSASALTAADPTKASGEEHFVIHALSDGSLAQSRIASARVQVCPVASGEIKGIAEGEILGSQAPQIELVLSDLYPRSDTHLLLFEGTQINGVENTIVKTYILDLAACESTVVRIPDLDSKITKDGTYTLALVSDTVYGRELLGKTVTFSVNRAPQVPAMQAQLSAARHP